VPNPHLIEPSPDGLHWYALKVFYNRVVYLKSLLPAGMESYVPVHTVETHKQGRLAYEEEPLIPSLLFVRCTPAWLVKFKYEYGGDFMYYTVKDPAGNNIPGPIRDEEMRSFILVTSADAGRGVKYFGADAPEYHTGDRVRVTDGIYKGAEGYIKRIKKDRKLIVAVTGVAVVAVSYIHPVFSGENLTHALRNEIQRDLRP
jgi:Transcription termination factor nusG.